MTPPKGGRPQGRVLVSGLLVHDVQLVLSGRPAHWPKHSGVKGSAKTATVRHPPSVPPGLLDGFGVQTHSNILSGPYAHVPSNLSLSLSLSLEAHGIPYTPKKTGLRVCWMSCTAPVRRSHSHLTAWHATHEDPGKHARRKCAEVGLREVHILSQADQVIASLCRTL